MADVVFTNPLNESHLRQINTGLQAIDDARRQIALAERAGIDVADRKALADKYEQQLIQLKQVYFPGR